MIHVSAPPFNTAHDFLECFFSAKWNTEKCKADPRRIPWFQLRSPAESAQFEARVQHSLENTTDPSWPQLHQAIIEAGKEIQFERVDTLLVCETLAAQFNCSSRPLENVVKRFEFLQLARLAEDEHVIHLREFKALSHKLEEEYAKLLDENISNCCRRFEHLYHRI